MSSAEYVQLYQFVMTPLPGSGGIIAPDPKEPVPDGAEDCGSWQPISVVPMPMGGGMSMVLVWARAVIAKKEETKETTSSPSKLIVPSAEDLKKLSK